MLIVLRWERAKFDTGEKTCPKIISFPSAPSPVRPWPCVLVSRGLVVPQLSMLIFTGWLSVDGRPRLYICYQSIPQNRLCALANTCVTDPTVDSRWGGGSVSGLHISWGYFLAVPCHFVVYAFSGGRISEQVLEIGGAMADNQYFNNSTCDFLWIFWSILLLPSFDPHWPLFVLLCIRPFIVRTTREYASVGIQRVNIPKSIDIFFLLEIVSSKLFWKLVK